MLSPKGRMQHTADSSDDRRAKWISQELVHTSDQSTLINETETAAVTSAFTKIKKTNPKTPLQEACMNLLSLKKEQLGLYFSILGRL